MGSPRSARDDNLINDRGINNPDLLINQHWDNANSYFLIVGDITEECVI